MVPVHSPLTILGMVELLLLRGAEVLDGLDGALREHGTQLERQVGRRPELFDGGAEHGRYALAAELGFATQRGPAVLAILPGKRP
jgi:hypothetical protein